MELAHATLVSWQTFYMIVGGSSGALIGLQFVIMTLMADGGANRSPEATSAFATPTVVHLSASLFISAIMTIPWSSASPVAFILGACGVLGVAYGLRTTRRAHRQSAYVPVWEDRLFYMILPVSAYLTVLGSGVLLRVRPQLAVELAATATLALLFLGIRNAWDTVTYIVLNASQNRKDDPTRL